MSGLNLLAPSSFTTLLVADQVATSGGSNDSTASITKVGAVPVSVCAEFQSTKGAVLFPRMTSAQIAAIVTPINGMQVYNSDLNAMEFYAGGVWSTASGAGASQVATVTLTQAQVNTMYTTPVLLVAAPAAGTAIIVDKVDMYTKFAVAAFTGGGVVVVQYDNTAHGAGTNTLIDTFPAAEVTAAASQVYSLAGVTAAALTGITAKGVYISNQTAVFATGNAASTITLTVRYHVITATV